MPTSDNWQEESAFPFLALSGVSFRPVGATRKNRAKRSFFFGGFFSRVRAVAVARTSRALSCLRAG
jgi:hypothetical protein